VRRSADFSKKNVFGTKKKKNHSHCHSLKTMLKTPSGAPNNQDVVYSNKKDVVY